MIKKFILLAAMAASLMSASAQTGINHPMTRAVIDAYSRQLQENPTDYEVWLSRANEYYRHNEYMRALNDVDNALKYIPTKDTETRCNALMLRANIYRQTDRDAEAVNDFNTILALDPKNYVAVYLRGNAYYSQGDYTSAKADYQRLQRLYPRSSEALVGLARVAVKESNLGVANEYLDQAVAADPNNTDLYVRRATVRRDMGNHQGAVEDLIVALATDSRNTRAMTLLVDYGNINYAAVAAGLTDAMRQAPNVGMYPYLRAMIAQYHYHYKAALTDYQTILDKNLYNYQGIYRSMAECLFAMGRFDEALAQVDHALEMDRNAGDAAVLRARILRAMGRYDEAKKQAATAVTMLPGNVDALNQFGLVYVNLKDYKEASALFAETTLTAGDTPEAQYSNLLRAWVLEQYLNQPVAAAGFYDKVAETGNDNPDNDKARMLGAFGRLATGHNAEATAIAADVLAANPVDPYMQYLGACFHAQAGDNDTALQCAERALEAGYANYYDWNYANDALLNVAPLRDDLRFLNLLDRYKHLWN